MRWIVLALVAALGAGGVLAAMALRSRPRDTAAAPEKPTLVAKGVSAATPSPSPASGPIHFDEIAERLGVQFSPLTGTTPEKLFPSANGTGVAMLDFDQDGYVDLYFANACHLDGAGPTPPNVLFRSHGATQFDDVTAQSATQVSGFTQGLAVADVDNDGFPDIYLLRYGPNILLHNNGDGTFSDVSIESGLADPRWGTSAAFLDYDEDGNLDVYVANYGQWDLAWHEGHFCGDMPRKIRLYCSPKQLAPDVHSLYRAVGDGTFVDKLSELGIARTDGRGQGVVACDVNNDGHIDLYVANDICPNFLFLNRGGGRFEDYTDLSCAAFNAEGKAEAGMGVDAADVNGDGLPDLFVTNFYLEHNTLYSNLGKDLFTDVSYLYGVATGSIEFVGWGTALEDLDGDGWPDIFVTNGHVDDNTTEFGRNEPYAQLPGLWHNTGGGKFRVVRDGGGPFFHSPHIGRGAAFGDLDNDGAVDIVVTHKDTPAAVLRNDSAEQSGVANSWVRLSLVGTRSARDAIGARVELVTGERRLVRHLRGGKSYLSAHDLRLTIGLGSATHIDRVTVYWPSGQTTTLQDLQASKPYTIREPLTPDL